MNTRARFVLAVAPVLLLTTSLVGSSALAGDELGDAALVESLASTKHSLLDGIRDAAKSPSVAISAKFEDEGKGLSLSVYVAGKGLGASADENVLRELAGSPTGAEWKPTTEVFEDVEHVARSAEQLTLMRQTTISLSDAVTRAQSETGGTAYSILPALSDGRAVFTVRLVIEGRPDAVDMDLQTGQILAAPRAGWPIPKLRAPDRVGHALPEIEVGKGKWIGNTPAPISTPTPGRVVLVVTNSLLCEGTDEAWMWEKLVPWFDELEKKGLSIRFVLQGASSADEVTAYMKKRNVRYSVLHDPTGENARRLNVGLAPAAFLVGPDGLVVWQGYWQPGKAADACERALRSALDRLGSGPR